MKRECDIHCGPTCQVEFDTWLALCLESDRAVRSGPFACRVVDLETDCNFTTPGKELTLSPARTCSQAVVGWRRSSG
jgi:hypothetical protein